jgi:hypothetical protein
VQDAQNGQTSHPPDPGGYFTRPPESGRTAALPRDAPFRRQGRSEQRGEEGSTALRLGRSPLE